MSPAKSILVTGAAGFIGSHLVEALVQSGHRVLGLDNFDDYYDPARKRRNLAEVTAALGASAPVIVDGDIRDRQLTDRVFGERPFDAVVHLAALAGVRTSMSQAVRYMDVNLLGTTNLLDACVAHHTRQFVFASTSSVYGNSPRVPFEENDLCDRPLAPYPASKRAGELLGYTYHHLHGLDFTALRFFTVYGPRNRPDMMAYKLMDNVAKGAQVVLYDRGNVIRDWTYVGDIVQGIVRAVERPLGYELINLGRGEPTRLADFVRIVEELGGRPAQWQDEPLPASDAERTCASIDKARALLGYAPATSLRNGLSALWAWYRPRDGSAG